MKKDTVNILIAFVGVSTLIAGVVIFQSWKKNESFQVSKVIAEPTNENNIFNVFLVSDLGERKKFGSLNNLYVDHSHWYEYKGENLYVIKRVGYDGASDSDWTDELWKYNGEDDGIRLYSAQGLDFRVSNDDAYVVALGDSDEIALFNRDGFLKSFSRNDFDPSIDESLWVTDLSWQDHEFWMRILGPKNLFVFLNAENQKFETFDLRERVVSPTDFSLNAPKRFLASSDYPRFFDVESLEEFKKNPTAVTFIVLDLKTNTVLLERESLGKEFDPQWIDAGTLEINAGDPFGSVREKIIIYQNAEYGFSVQIPAEFSIDNQALPSDGRILSQVLLRRKNQNTSQDARRDTPIGFNTSVDDRAYLITYSNANHLAPASDSETQDFLVWHDSITSNQKITRQQVMTLGQDSIFFTHEINGVEGATGQYLYFFSDDYIFVLESNDVPEDELLNIGETFKF